MRAYPGLGLVNFALVSAYFTSAWGRDALQVLTSPYNGFGIFEDRAHAAAAIYFGDVFDLGHAGLIRVQEALAGLKMVVAAAFLAYLIEFVRAVATRCEPDRKTVDVVLLLALGTAIIWILPTMALGDHDIIRLQMTRLLLLVGAAIVLMVERHIEHSAPTRVAAGPAAPAHAALVTLPPVSAALP
jgi:hypothetical protein